MSKNTNLSFLTDYITADITNGRIGINTPSPAYSFDVTGIARTSTSTYLATASGNVGIGTSSPNDLLELKSTSANQGNIRLYNTFNSGTSDFGINWFRDYDSATNAIAAYIRYNRGGGSAGEMTFGTGTNAGVSERMRITSAGNVGIGTSSPSAKLEVNGYGTANSIMTYVAAKFYGAGSGGVNIGTDGTVAMIATDTSGADLTFLTRVSGVFYERLRIASDGVVTITSGKQLSINSGVTGDAGLFIKSEGTTTTGFTNIQGFHGGVGYNSSIVMQRYGGNILMGTTSNNGERLYVSGDIRATGSITANSDISLKKNLLKIENALEKVEQINGYTYEFKEDDSKRHAGVIAQEIQTVLPEIVNKGNDGILGVEYGNISALLIEAIKELKAEIETLKNK